MSKHFYLIFLMLMPTFIFGQVTADFTTDNSSGEYCLGDTVFFTNTSSGSYVISYWDFGDGYDTWAENPYHIFENTGSYSVSLTVTDSSGASSSTSASISVADVPSLSLTDDAILQSITAQSIDQNLTYEWMFNGALTAETDSVVYYLESGTFTAIATSLNGCSTSASIEIKIGGDTPVNPEDTLKIIVKNNILTPGVQDGANDILFIDGLSTYSTPCNVTIFNKWGQLVYQNTEYTNFGGFEGKDNNGRELDAGTYYYVIKNENRKTATGYIDLIR